MWTKINKTNLTKKLSKQLKKKKKSDLLKSSGQISSKYLRTSMCFLKSRSAEVEGDGQRRTGPKQTARLSTVILFRSLFEATRFK